MTNSIRIQPNQSRAFTLVELLVVIAIIGILVALLLPAIQAAREAARRAQCESNLHNVGLAVLNYESAKKILPNGMNVDLDEIGIGPPEIPQTAKISGMTKFRKNWIIEILPYMEEQALYDSFDFTKVINDATATAPNNRNYLARGQVINTLLCPSDPYNKMPYQGHNGNWARSNYAGNTGRAFIYFSASAYNENFGRDSLGWKDRGASYTGCQRGVFGVNTSVKLKQITDGTSKSFMLGEVRAGIVDDDPRGVWALGHAGPSLLAAYGAVTDDSGPNNCFLNGDDNPSQLCVPTGGTPNPNPVAAQECMNCYRAGFDQQTMRSVHPAGVHAAMADGSVEYISNEIDVSAGLTSKCCTVWDRMIASADEGRAGGLQSNALNGLCQ